MDVLIIGYSNIALRRVIPALLGIEEVGRIHIATSRSGLEVDLPAGKKGNIVTGYDAALDQLSPCLAYISLPNHLHGSYVKKALQRGFHVVVDKPAFLSKQDLDEALFIANSNGLCLAEAVVWPFHDQVAALKEKIRLENLDIRAIQGVFSMPPLPPSNFRNDPTRGGGAFNDLAAYAVTPGRVFYEELPLEVACRILSRNESTGIDTGFSFEALFTQGRIFQGFYGFTTEYHNSLVLLGDKFSAQISPAYTIGPATDAMVAIHSRNQDSQMTTAGCDMFRNFLELVISSVNLGEYDKWVDILQQDGDVYFRAAQVSGKTKWQ